MKILKCVMVGDGAAGKTYAAEAYKKKCYPSYLGYVPTVREINKKLIWTLIAHLSTMDAARWMTCVFTSFLTVFQSNQDDGWMIMKCSNGTKLTNE